MKIIKRSLNHYKKYISYVVHQISLQMDSRKNIIILSEIFYVIYIYLTNENILI